MYFYEYVVCTQLYSVCVCVSNLKVEILGAYRELIINEEKAYFREICFLEERNIQISADREEISTCKWTLCCMNFHDELKIYIAVSLLKSDRGREINNEILLENVIYYIFMILLLYGN